MMQEKHIDCSDKNTFSIVELVNRHRRTAHGDLVQLPLMIPFDESQNVASLKLHSIFVYLVDMTVIQKWLHRGLYNWRWTLPINRVLQFHGSIMTTCNNQMHFTVVESRKRLNGTLYSLILTLSNLHQYQFHKRGFETYIWTGIGGVRIIEGAAEDAVDGVRLRRNMP